jgi:REP element-mobilizing transposase RayT
MVRGIEGGKIVSDDTDRDDFVARLSRVAAETITPIYAWALLTNHAHMLLRSGPRGLPHAMQRLLTGYATAYNLRHRRHGHLFQNRYKSIVCDAEAYFLELVRYIHLNPLRAGLVRSVAELDRYPYSGHRAIIAQRPMRGQDCASVLQSFAPCPNQAVRAYAHFVELGVAKEERHELTPTPQGSATERRRLRKQPQTRAESNAEDTRILGDERFVRRVLAEMGDRPQRATERRCDEETIRHLIQQVCDRYGTSATELSSGSRRKAVSRARCEIAETLALLRGVPLVVIARHAGVSPCAITKILRRSSDRGRS